MNCPIMRGEAAAVPGAGWLSDAPGAPLALPAARSALRGARRKMTDSREQKKQ